MAKTRAEWNTIIANNVAIVDLSESTAAEWLMFRNMVVTVAMVLETIFELFQTEVNEALASKQPWSLPSWPALVKSFQYGDDLVVTDGVVAYAEVDTDAQIVTQASVKETEDGILQIKVAKDDVDGTKIQLTNAELTALTNYIKSRRPPGVAVSVMSNPADVVKYTLTVRYDSGYNKATVQENIVAALDEYRNDLPFNAVFYKSKVIDIVHNVAGVRSVVVRIDMTLKGGTETVSNLSELKELPAGYFNWDDTSGITMVTA